MKTDDFVRDIRFLLGDLPERSSTSSLTWETDEILATASQCRDTLIKVLWNQKRSNKQPFQMTISWLVKTYGFTTVLPNGFWKGLCGTLADGGYVPFLADERSYGLLAMGDDILTVAHGTLQGTADAVWYVALPTAPLKSGTLPTQFSDSFYECLELLTCLTLLGKKERGSVDAMMFLAKEIARVVPTLI